MRTTREALAVDVEAPARCRARDRRRAHTRTISPDHHRLARGARACRPPTRRSAARERAHRQPVEHVVEEPEHDEPLGLLGRDAAALEVVELVVVDRADGGRVRALHVVGLDLEVRDRLRARALGEHEVAVGLVRARPSGRRSRMRIEARVHRPGGVLDRALEQQVAARAAARRGPAGCGSRASGRRRRSRPRAGRSRRPGRSSTRLAAQARVVAAERDRRRPQRRVATDVRALQRDAATCAGRAPAPRGSARARCRRR